MTWKLLRCLLLVLAVGAASGEAWAKNWNLDKQENEKHALASFSDARLCMFATDRGNWEQRLSHEKYVREAKRRDLSCGVGATTQLSKKPRPSSYLELIAAQSVVVKSTLRLKVTTRIGTTTTMCLTARTGNQRTVGNCN